MSSFSQHEPGQGAATYAGPLGGPARGRWEVEEDAQSVEAELRMKLLARAIEYEIIPRLMLAHRAQNECVALPVLDGQRVSQEDVEAFAKLVLFQDEAVAKASIHAMRVRGVSVETIYLDLLAPVARYLGDLWERDLCDFVEVTLGLGRLQQVLRDTCAEFGQQHSAPSCGLRILLMPCPGEHHTFGIAMVAEFFSRAGWEVVGGLSDLVLDAASMARNEWFDVVGFSLGGETHLGTLNECIRSVRLATRNPQVGIIVGGPLLIKHPAYERQIEADAMILDGKTAPELASKLVHSVRQAGK